MLFSFSGLSFFACLLACGNKYPSARLRGNELLAAKDLAGALAAYTEAISLDGSDAAFRSNRSAVHMSMGAHEKALLDAEVLVVVGGSGGGIVA